MKAYKEYLAYFLDNDMDGINNIKIASLIFIGIPYIKYAINKGVKAQIKSNTTSLANCKLRSVADIIVLLPNKLLYIVLTNIPESIINNIQNNIVTQYGKIHVYIYIIICL